MTPDDPTWNDPGFQDDGGFLPDPAKQAPVAEPEATARTRVVPTVEPPPPAIDDDRRSAGAWFGIVASVLGTAVLGGVAIWYFLLRTPPEEAMFYGDETSTEEQQPVRTGPVKDSGIVVASESAPPAAVDVDSVDTTVLASNQAQLAKPQQIPSTSAPTKPAAAASLDNTPASRPAPAPSTVPMKENRGGESRKPETAAVPKREAPIVKPTPQLQTKTPPSANGALYTVQVFSSPSQDDAEEWRDMLREKNVSDVTIVAQNIKGQTWYRVRFGSFARRDEAERTAVTMGFTQPWIARIR
ncbi:MAG: SPOR domain-containing protein [Candidatus Kapabacteria bacterium]|nr:SPOR domain-containing protein [Candidatus Kapabacteria bacterium]